MNEEIKRINQRIHKLSQCLYQPYQIKKYKTRQLNKKSREWLYFIISIQAGNLTKQQKAIYKLRWNLRESLKIIKKMVMKNKRT